MLEAPIKQTNSTIMQMLLKSLHLKKPKNTSIFYCFRTISLPMLLTLSFLFSVFCILTDSISMNINITILIQYFRKTSNLQGLISLERREH